MSSTQVVENSFQLVFINEFLIFSPLLVTFEDLQNYKKQPLSRRLCSLLREAFIYVKHQAYNKPLIEVKLKLWQGICQFVTKMANIYLCMYMCVYVCMYIYIYIYIYVVVVQLLSCVSLFATPQTTVRQTSLSFTTSQSLLKFMSIESVMQSNHLILCCSHLVLPSIFSSIRIFFNASVLHIREPK